MVNLHHGEVYLSSVSAVKVGWKDVVECAVKILGSLCGSKNKVEETKPICLVTRVLEWWNC